MAFLQAEYKYLGVVTSDVATPYMLKNQLLKRVRVSTKMLQAYFNDRDYWIRINEMNGNINL